MQYGPRTLKINKLAPLCLQRGRGPYGGVRQTITAADSPHSLGRALHLAFDVRGRGGAGRQGQRSMHPLKPILVPGPTASVVPVQVFTSSGGGARQLDLLIWELPRENMPT